MGIGNNRFENIIQVYAHSNPIEILANLGIIGFSIYYSLYVIILVKLHAIKKKVSEARLLEIIFICLILMEFVCVIYETESNQIVIATIWLGATILYRDNSRYVVNDKKRMKEGREE